jgi:serine O-acetyltransferase
MIVDGVWEKIRVEAEEMKDKEPILGTFFLQAILNQKNFLHALSFNLANKLSSPIMPAIVLREIFTEILKSDKDIIESSAIDLQAVVDRDPAVIFYITPFLYLKGYQAIESYRIAHKLWIDGRRELAYFLQNQISLVFGVDIHPAAKIGRGIMFDHATGIVIGETAIVGDNVSMLHNVTLGGTGHEQGDRHPKIGSGVMIGAGASILGNITIGNGAKVGAGSVVLQNVSPHTTVAGVPAKVVGKCNCDMPAAEMDQQL